MMNVITNPISNIPKNEKSHVHGWSQLWRDQLSAFIDHKCTPQITKVDHAPPIKELIGLRGRYFSGQGLSSELIHHVLHESDDVSTSSGGSAHHEAHIPLDLGTQTLQRIIDQLKTLMTLSRSDPSSSEAFNAGLPHYCQYLKGEKAKKPSFLSLEDILAKKSSSLK